MKMQRLRTQCLKQERIQMQVILTFDVGTTSMKCCAFDEQFRIIDSVTIEYALETRGENFIEVDPAVYWKGLCDSTRTLFSRSLRPENVAAVAITTQGETTIVLDGHDTPILPAIVWLDNRAGAQAEDLSAHIDIRRFYSTTGLPSISGTMPVAKLKWIMEQPELRNRVRKILLLEDYLIYRLTGQFVTEHSLVCSTGYYNIITHRYESGILDLAGVPEELLPEVLPCGSMAGSVTGISAGETGLRPGTPVVCTAMDQTSSAVGAGNITVGTVSETTGTCLTIVATAEKPDFDAASALQYYTHYNDKYLALAYNPTAAIIMKWFKDQFVADTEGLKAAGINAYNYMSELAAAVPPGSDGLLLIPHFTGKSMPDTYDAMRGCFMGLSLGTTRGHFIRAIMEGVAYMMRENLGMFNAAGIPVSQIRSLGGGARDTLWCAIKASVAGCEVLTMENDESTSLGAAILAAGAIGRTGDVAALSLQLARSKASYMPDPDWQKVYNRLYRDYKRLDAMAAAFYGR
jgi:xylulokinase